MPGARAVVVLLVCLSLVPAQSPEKRSEPRPANAEVLFADGSSLKLKLLDDTIDHVTPYGTLRIPVRVIRKIEFGMRLTDAEAKEIDTAIADLTGSNPAKRETAKALLTGLGDKALPALRRASRDATGEAITHLETVLEKMIVGRASPEPRDADVVFTEDSQIAGRVAVPSVRVMTTQFGEQRLKFDGVKVLLGPAGDTGNELATVIDAPMTLTNYQNRIGLVLTLRVTGAISGTIWGTGTYTLDSSVAMAVVHAGVLTVGQTGIVRVRIIASPAAFAGTVQNGITSNNYGVYPSGAYEILSGRR